MVEGNLIKWYEESFREHRELPALTDYFKKEQFSYFEMAKEIAKLHILFSHCKIKKGDKIALIGRNNPRWCIAYIATITYGAVIVPILQEFNPNDVHHIINHSDSKLLFVGDTLWDSIEPSSIDNIKAIFSLTDYSCLYDNCKNKIKTFQQEINKHYRKKYPTGFTSSCIKYADVHNDEVILLNYTSGTTGFSKGVMLTVNNLTGNVALGIRTGLHYKGSRVLAFLPLAHAYGCAFDFLLPLATGSHITLLGRIPSPKILIEALAEVKPCLVICVPMIIEKIYKKQIKPMLEKHLLRLALNVPLVNNRIYAQIRKKLMSAFGDNATQIIIGGAPLNAEVENFLHKIKFPFTVGYGMTECAPLISYAFWKDFQPTSCGKPIEGLMNVRIDSPDPHKIPGEICVWGEHVMKGYYKNEEATREVLEENGVLHTGDLGIIGEDGTLFIRGRSKTMILGASGQNIFPEEIESKFNNMPYVAECLVVDRNGRLTALIYPDFELADNNNIPHSQIGDVLEEVRLEVNKSLASYEQIAKVIVYPTEFEKTPKRSIKRYLYNV